MDNLKQERLPNYPLDLAPQFPAWSSSHGGSSAVCSATLPIGSHLNSLSRVCGPQIGLWSSDQSSYQARQKELEAESELEDESAARMQSLVPSGLLQDDGRDHRDGFSLFPSPVEVLSDTNQIESKQQEFLWGEVYQSYARNGFVGARRDQRFDSYRPSDHVEGVAVRHARTRTGGHDDPNSAGRRVGQNSAGRYVDQSPAGGYVPNPGEGHVPAPAQGYFQCTEAIRRTHESALTASSELIVASDERENLFQQEGFHHHNQLRGLASNRIEPSSLLERNKAVMLIDEAAGLRNRTYEQDYRPSEAELKAELENARDQIFQMQWMKNMLNLLMLDFDRQAINAKLFQRNGFLSPQPASSVNTTAVLSAAVTPSHSTPATMHPAASRVRSRDLRQENSSVLSRSASRSLRNTPEKKPDGYPSNPYSPPRQKATSASGSATKALIARGEKSISVILKPEHSGSRSRSSHSASPLSPASNPVSPGSGSLSPIRPRRLNMSNIDDLQLIPTENPSLELDVCNQGQFKTELCNNWQESRWCRYGDHCRFAHGVQELRCVLRHHRYKSVPCRMIMSGKECIYGHRCHYRHSFTEKELSLISEAKLVPRTTL